MASVPVTLAGQLWILQLSPPDKFDRAVSASAHNGSKAAIRYLQSLVERDKTALARELHDDLGGYLVATAMDIAELKRRVGQGA